MKKTEFREKTKQRYLSKEETLRKTIQKGIEIYVNEF